MSIEGCSPSIAAPVPHHALELGDHWEVAVGRGEGGVERFLGHWWGHRGIHADRQGFKRKGRRGRGRGESRWKKWKGGGVRWTSILARGSPKFRGLAQNKVVGNGLAIGIVLGKGLAYGEVLGKRVE
jgi:hypothetical protein